MRKSLKRLIKSLLMRPAPKRVHINIHVLSFNFIKDKNNIRYISIASGYFFENLSLTPNAL